jgi:hypothetical protein
MADGPQFLAIARGVVAAREWEIAGETDVRVKISLGIGRGVEQLQRDAVFARRVRGFRLRNLFLVAFLPFLLRRLELLKIHDYLLRTGRDSIAARV